MATFNLPAVPLLANVEFDSPGQSVGGAIASSAQVTMTDPNGLWPASPDNTRHVKVWGIQINRNDGKGWLWWLFSGDPTTSAVPVNGGYAGPTGSAIWLPFGLRLKNGGMPMIRVDSSGIIEAAGSQLRLAILTDAPITLGASIVVT